jgi:hypothetical protein
MNGLGLGICGLVCCFDRLALLVEAGEGMSETVVRNTIAQEIKIARRLNSSSKVDSYFFIFPFPFLQTSLAWRLLNLDRSPQSMPFRSSPLHQF